MLHTKCYIYIKYNIITLREVETEKDVGLFYLMATKISLIKGGRMSMNLFIIKMPLSRILFCLGNVLAGYIIKKSNEFHQEHPQACNQASNITSSRLGNAINQNANSIGYIY